MEGFSFFFRHRVASTSTITPTTTALYVYTRRYIPQRSRDPPHYHIMKQLTEVFDQTEIPFIANGDVLEPEDIQRIRDATGIVDCVRSF